MLVHLIRTALLLLCGLVLTSCGTQSAAPPIAPPTPSAPASEATAYLDDRSSPEALINSLYNAVNRREYARAYSYWRADAPELPSYDAFVEGYRATQRVQTSYGATSGDAGAGQARYALPFALSVEANAGMQYFVGCYVLRLSSPGAQATPPYQPLAIEDAAVRPSPAPPTGEELAQACAVEGSPVPPAPPADTIDASVYLDDIVLQIMFLLGRFGRAIGRSIKVGTHQLATAAGLFWKLVRAVSTASTSASNVGK